MEKITIIVNNKRTLTKLNKLLSQFSEDEIKIIKEEKRKEDSKKKKQKKYSDEYVLKNWKKFVYSASGDLNKDDDDLLPDAYLEYLSDKSSF